MSEKIEFIKSKKIRIMSDRRVWDKLGKTYILGPVTDSESGMVIYSGLEIFPEEIRDKIIEEYKHQGIEDLLKRDTPIRKNQTLDLNTAIGIVTYGRCLLSDVVAFSRREYNHSHIFWLHDEEAEAEKEISQVSEIEKAVVYINSLTEHQVRDVAIFLSIGVNHTPKAVYEAQVKRTAISNPSEILKYKESGSKDQLIFVKKLAIYNLIKKHPDGYFYGNEYLGSSPEGVIAELYKPSNAHLVSKLGKSLEAFENPSKENVENIIRDVQNDEADKKVESMKKENELMQAKYQYMLITKEEWTGDDDLEILQSQIEIEKKVKDFITLSTEKDVRGVKAHICKKVTPELYQEFKSMEDINSISERYINYLRTGI